MPQFIINTIEVLGKGDLELLYTLNDSIRTISEHLLDIYHNFPHSSYLLIHLGSYFPIIDLQKM